jgi:serine/threonine protein phosphatase PrpC
VATHVGRRENNEDASCALPELGLYAVADGLGGYEGGEVASLLATRTLAEFVARRRDELDRSPPSSEEEQFDLWEDILVEGFCRAHEAIVAAQVGPLAMMGSTLAAVLVPDGVAIICHVGDSRVYLLRDELRQLTRDHTLYAEVLARGAEVPADLRSSLRNELTRALGIEGGDAPDTLRVPVRPGDVFLICSDGVYDSLPLEEIRCTLQGGDPRQACESLVRKGYEQGGSDNMTAVVIHVREVTPLVLATKDPAEMMPTVKACVDSERQGRVQANSQSGLGGTQSRPPRILLVMSDHWTRALLRAELIERGYDVVGAPDLLTALLCRPVERDRGPVRAILIDQEVLVEPAVRLLDLLVSRHRNATVLLLASTLLAAPSGPWKRVLHKPATIGGIASAVEETVPRVSA